MRLQQQGGFVQHRRSEALLSSTKHASEITVHTADGCRRKADLLVVEEPLEIWLQQYTSSGQTRLERLATTMRTPGDDQALVRGWVITSGLLAPETIHQVRHTGAQTLRNGTSNQVVVEVRPGTQVDASYLARFGDIESSCGICGTQRIEQLLARLPDSPARAEWQLSLSKLDTVMTQLEQPQSVYRQTGACHGALLLGAGLVLLAHKEDAGRHNAVDKVIGEAVGKPDAPMALALSGRVSMELAQKAAMVGVSLIMARGAPTSLALALCRERDISLLGFVRAEQVNVYHDAGVRWCNEEEQSHE